jgi:hypothetical protein
VSYDPDGLQQLLRAARPEPPPEFVRELERSLTHRNPARAERRRLHVLVAGSGFAAGLAAIAVALSVAGLLPIGSSGEHAEADVNCTIATVERVQPRPMFVRDRDGRYQIHYRPGWAPRLVRRCR